MAKHIQPHLRRARAGLDLTLDFNASFSKTRNRASTFPCSHKVINQYQVNPVILSNDLPPVNDYHEVPYEFWLNPQKRHHLEVTENLIENRLDEPTSMAYIIYFLDRPDLSR